MTFRGTVEFRSVCTQPVSEIMTSPAFHAGLVNKVDELKQILDNDNVIFSKGLNSEELREQFNRGVFPDFIDEEKLKTLIYQILDLAANGLKDRGYNEEHFLVPLYHRTDHLFSPAKQLADGVCSGVPIEYYIKEYAKL